MKGLKMVIVMLFLSFGMARGVEAVEKARVVKIIEEREMVTAGEKHLFQKLELMIGENEVVEINNGEIPLANLQRYKVGQKLIVEEIPETNGSYQIVDYDRTDALVWLTGIFVTMALIVGGWQGGTSILGLVLSFAVVFKVLLPALIAGKDPLLWSIISALMILPVTFFMSHGINRKTLVALVGTFFTLILAGGLSILFANLANLTGYASEEAGFVGGMLGLSLDMRGLLLAGMILGLVGVIDDVTVSQVAMVFQMKELSKSIKPGELFLRAMRVGRDHIASMINTLILVYAAASIPLLMLFVGANRSWGELVNLEVVSEELIRMLVGSIGVLASVPMTTFLAVVMAPKHSK
jgi:uncharacterized membrane protein